MEGKTDEMEEKTNKMEGKINGERLMIVRVEYVIETTFAILNTSSSNGTVATRQSLRGNSRLKWICRSFYPLYLGSKSIQACVFGKEVRR